VTPRTMNCPGCGQVVKYQPLDYDCPDDIRIHIRCWNDAIAEGGGWRATATSPATSAVSSRSQRSKFFRQFGAVLESRAFRRLGYKTQLLTNHEGDLHRTRLTHTLHVVYLAETIADVLKLDADLTRTIALAHDLGHTPFGHAGERAIQEWLWSRHNASLALPAGKKDPDYRRHLFSHNYQSVRVVKELEAQYLNVRGLKLDPVVPDGILRHSERFLAPGNPRWSHLEDYNGISRARAVASWDGMRNQLAPAASLEGQVVFWADEIAQLFHDLEDALNFGVIHPADFAEHPFWLTEVQQFLQKHQGKAPQDDHRAISVAFGSHRLAPPAPEHLAQATSLIQKYLVRNLLLSTFENLWNWVDGKSLAQLKTTFPADVATGAPEPLCGYEAPVFKAIDDFKGQFLEARMFGKDGDSRIAAMNRKAGRIVRDLLDTVASDPKLIPDPWRDNRTRTLPPIGHTLNPDLQVVDYVATLTDREALQFHRNIFGDAQERLYIPVG
jgi:dGTPase